MSDYREEFFANYHKTNALAETPLKEYYLASSRQYAGRWKKWLPSDKSSRCLDLACGEGEFLYWLKSLGYENLYGVDLNRIQLEHAQQMGVPNLEQGDLFAYLRKTDEPFDLISAFNLFEHLKKEEILELLRLIFDSLKLGGRLIAITPNGISPFSGTTRYWDFSHETGFTPASWRQISRLTGFTSAEFEEYGPMPISWKGRIRVVLWQLIRWVIMGVSYVEVARPRDISKVFTADMKIILTKSAHAGSD